MTFKLCPECGDRMHMKEIKPYNEFIWRCIGCGSTETHEEYLARIKKEWGFY